MEYEVTSENKAPQTSLEGEAENRFASLPFGGAGGNL